MEVDKRHLHEVRRQVEAMALKIFCAKLVGNAENMSAQIERISLDYSVQYAIDLRKKIDEMVKEKSSPVPTGDIDKTLGTTV